jgi:hypothetical protein
MQYQCVPASSAQTLDEFHAEHYYPCFLYDDKVFISFGISPTSKCEIVYRVKELGTAIDKEASPTLLRGSTTVTPANLVFLEAAGTTPGWP